MASAASTNRGAAPRQRRGTASCCSPAPAGAAPCAAARRPNRARGRGRRAPRRIGMRLLQRGLRAQQFLCAGGSLPADLVEPQRKSGALPAGSFMPRRLPSQARQTGSAAWSVRSTCSGVIETAPVATAWKSVPFAAFARVAGRADPVDGVAARAGLADHRLARMAAAQAGDAPRQRVGIGAVGDVHVQQPGPRRRAVCARHARSRCAPRAPLRRDAPSPSTTCENAIAGMPNRKPSIAAGHRARMKRVVAHVGAVVDARDDQIGPLRQQPGERDVHAVGRRAGDVAERVERLAVAVARRVDRQRRFSVSEFEVPLAFCSGATTSISPSPRRPGSARRCRARDNRRRWR